MLNIAEVFILYSSQNNDDIRLNLFISIINYLLSISHRISRPQKDILKILAQDFNCPDLLNSFPEKDKDEDGNEDEISLQDYNGSIGIYTLIDGAAQRASSVLKKYYPRARIEVNNDHDATDRLKSLAENSDIFVFAWKSGKGSASIIKCVTDKIYA